MNVVFKSIIKGQDKEDQIIEFTDKLELTEFNGFNVYEFKEPSQGIQNRIEVSGVMVNIFAGPSTINLELDKKVTNIYQTPAGSMNLVAHMTKLDANRDNPSWVYTLKVGEQLVGEYHLSLQVK